MSDDSIQINDNGAVREITLSHAGKKNALSRKMLAELTVAVTEIPDTIHVVILHGAGDVFSSGFFIDEIDEDEIRRGVDPISNTSKAISDCSSIVITAIEGVCMGGAFELALACHLAVVTPDARIRVPSGKLGLVYPQVGLARFVTRLGAPMTRRLLLAGETITGKELFDQGVLGYLDDEPLARAQSVADKICAQAWPATKATHQIVSWLDVGRAREVDVAKLRADVLESPEFRDRLKAGRSSKP